MEKYIKTSFEVIDFGKDNILTESLVDPNPHFVDGGVTTSADTQTQWKEAWNNENLW